MVLLVLAKVTNVYVPILYKYAVDALGEPAAQAVAVPIALILAYGVARVLAQAFGEVRDAIFAPVSQRAIRNLALEVFGHLHALSLRFHLERQTGGLSRVIERGTQGMEFLIRFTTFNILPTLFEIVLVGGDPVEPLRLALLGGHAGRRRRLHRVLGRAVGMAHQVRAPHERRRHRGQRQGDRQPAELRDGQVFRQRGPRGAPLRRRPPALRDRRDPLQPHPVAAQHRPGRHHRAAAWSPVMVDGGLRRGRRAP